LQASQHQLLYFFHEDTNKKLELYSYTWANVENQTHIEFYLAKFCILSFIQIMQIFAKCPDVASVQKFVSAK
jgi:hypothetical protein